MTWTPRLLAAAAIASLAGGATALPPPRVVAARPAPAASTAPIPPPEKAWLDFETGQFREVTPADLERLEAMRADEEERSASPAAIV